MTVLVYKSMSLDGYVTGPDVSVEHAMGVGGERLHDWMFAEPVSEVDQKMVAEIRRQVGAVVIGRRTFDLGLPHWGDVPFPAPSFVVTHEALPPREAKSGTFTFVGDVREAIDAARQQAGDKKVVLMGADLSRQALRAGFVDELLIDHVPVLLGAGTRLFEDTGTLELEPFEVAASPVVTHVRYRVVR